MGCLPASLHNQSLPGPFPFPTHLLLTLGYTILLSNVIIHLPFPFYRYLFKTPVPVSPSFLLPLFPILLPPQFFSFSSSSALTSRFINSSFSFCFFFTFLFPFFHIYQYVHIFFPYLFFYFNFNLLHLPFLYNILHFIIFNFLLPSISSPLPPSWITISQTLVIIIAENYPTWPPSLRTNPPSLSPLISHGSGRTKTRWLRG